MTLEPKRNGKTKWRATSIITKEQKWPKWIYAKRPLLRRLHVQPITTRRGRIVFTILERENFREGKLTERARRRTRTRDIYSSYT